MALMLVLINSHSERKWTITPSISQMRFLTSPLHHNVQIRRFFKLTWATSITSKMSRQSHLTYSFRTPYRPGNLQMVTHSVAPVPIHSARQVVAILSNHQAIRLNFLFTRLLPSWLMLSKPWLWQLAYNSTLLSLKSVVTSLWLTSSHVWTSRSLPKLPLFLSFTPMKSTPGKKATSSINSC